MPDYFDILPYTWLSGSKKTALTSTPILWYLRKAARKTYFGYLPPDQMIGRTITYDDSLTVTVTGILQDWNKNSDFTFSDFYVSSCTITNGVLKHRFPLDNPHVINNAGQMLVKLPSLGSILHK